MIFGMGIMVIMVVHVESTIEKDYYISFARKLYKIITEDEIEDENGNVMQGWMVP